MKKANIYFTILKLVLDYFIIFGTFFLAREIRLVTDLIPSVSLPVQTIVTDELTKFSLLGALVLVIIFLGHGLYRFDSSWGRIKEYSKILLYSFYSFVFFTVIVYLGQGFVFEKEIPRLIIGFTFFFGSIFLIIERLLISLLRDFLYSRNFLKKSNIFIISNKSSKEFKNLLEGFKYSNEYTILGISDCTKLRSKGLKRYSLSGLKKIIKDRKIDEILYVNSTYSNDDIIELWDLSRIFGIKYRYIANSFSSLICRISNINNFSARFF